MKIKRIKLFASTLALGVMLSNSISVFADDKTPITESDKYDIVYSGGEVLGASNVTIAPELINNLEPLLGTEDKVPTLTFSNSSMWQKGSQKLSNDENAKCRQIRYVKVYNDNTIGANSNLSFSLSYGDYKVTTRIDGVSISGLRLGEGKFVPIIVDETDNFVYVRSDNVYSDTNCQTSLDNVVGPNIQNAGAAFIDLNIKLTKGNKAYNSNDLYFGILDIDSAQSFKILNTGNELTKSNMFAKDASKIQGSSTYKNKYVSSGKYIYSEFGDDVLKAPGESDVFVKLTSATQNDGLDIVFGYQSNAGSSIDYYARQYKVTYISDDNGEITGIKKEDVLSGDNPAGSTQKPNEGYEFTYWTADVDVTLEDGTVIKKGEKLTDAQIKQVVVAQDIEFKAFHAPKPKKEEPAVPNTGASTGELNAAPIAISVIGVALGALFIGLLPHLTRKKVKFD